MAKTTPEDLMRICEALEVRYGQRKQTEFNDFIESLIYQILELATPERTARDALKRIREEHVDWNDMRVATVREIQDILGTRYPRCREKAEDLSSLLADLYTAFRRMDLCDMARTPEGIETLRALPDTTLIREDMVERALLVVCHVHTFPCDEEQFELLKYLGGVPKNAELETHRAVVEELLDGEQMIRLARGLREHADLLYQAEEDDPQPINYGWDQPDPLAKKAAAKKKAAPKK
jgi:endonuclease III